MLHVGPTRRIRRRYEGDVAFMPSMSCVDGRELIKDDYARDIIRGNSFSSFRHIASPRLIFHSSLIHGEGSANSSVQC